MKDKKNIILYAILVLLIGILGWQNFKQRQMIDDQTVQLSSKNTDDNKYTTIVYDQNIETLKKNNKELYDSLKVYKDQIDYLVQFKYKKKYVIHDTIIQLDTIPDKNVIINEYTYSNKDKNDTLNYQLKIGSTTEPYWYSLTFDVSDKFTIVNKRVDNINETTIESGSKDTDISEVVVVKQKQNKKIKDRIAIGPSISGGYGILNKKFDIMVGVSLTYDLW